MTPRRSCSDRPTAARRWWTPWAAAGSLGAALVCGGCNIIGFGGAVVESYRRNSTKTVDPEYVGLAGHSFAVVVSADRAIQSDYPEIVARLTAGISERLRDPANGVGASGWVPPAKLLQYLYDHPRWVTMPHSELAKSLGVERIVYVELREYRLNDPGNQYLWEGVAEGTVGVIDPESPMPDEFVFERPVRVKFPDKAGYGPADMPGQAVNTELARRFTDRASWPFYSHEEKYYPDY